MANPVYLKIKALLFKLHSVSLHRYFVFSLIILFGIVLGQKSFATTCSSGASCGGDGESCYVVIPTPPSGTTTSVCSDATPSQYKSGCTCDGTLMCNTSTWVCEDCDSVGDSCCGNTQCVAPLVCTTTLYGKVCTEDTNDCNDPGETCCPGDVCEDSSLYGAMICDGGVCQPEHEGDETWCTYNRVSMHLDGYQACCDDIGERCCGTSTDTCFGGLDCYGTVCGDDPTDANCGTLGDHCCVTATGSLYCIEGGCDISTTYCVAGSSPESIFEIMQYDGPIINDIAGLLSPVFKILFYAGIFVGIMGIIYSGYLLMVSEGDPGRAKEGKEQFTAAILGSLFILLSVFILRAIINSILGVDSGL